MDSTMVTAEATAFRVATTACLIFCPRSGIDR